MDRRIDSLLAMTVSFKRDDLLLQIFRRRSPISD
jgi:hypothetical protein